MAIIIMNHRMTAKSLLSAVSQVSSMNRKRNVSNCRRKGLGCLLPGKPEVESLTLQALNPKILKPQP